MPSPVWNGEAGASPTITWNADLFDSTHVNVEFVITRPNERNMIVHDIVLLVTNAPNHGRISFSPVVLGQLEENLPFPMPGAVRITPIPLWTGIHEWYAKSYVANKVSKNKREMDEDDLWNLFKLHLPSNYVTFREVREIPIGTDDRIYLWTDIHEAKWYAKSYVANVAWKNQRGIPTDVDSWNSFKHYFPSKYATFYEVWERVGEKVTLPDGSQHTILQDVLNSLMSKKCYDWANEDDKDRFNAMSLLSVPCNIKQAKRDPNFYQVSHGVESCNSGVCSYFHPGSSNCVRSRQPSQNGAAQHACYDDYGDLIVAGPEKGTPDKVAIEPWHSHSPNNLPKLPTIIGHFWHDVRGYIYCNKWSSNEAIYFDRRPTDDCSGYVPPTIGFGFGDPHITTFDGLQYTFNGLGEYVVLDIPSEDLKIQGRTQRTLKQDGDVLVPTNATEWLAIVAKKSGSDIIEINTHKRWGLDVKVNSERQVLEHLSQHSFNGVRVSTGLDTDGGILVTVSFPRILLTIKTLTSIRLSFSISLDHRLKGKTKGLLGMWNGEVNDDLQASNGQIIPHDATSHEIFIYFGETWRVTATSSLFTYSHDKGYTDYNDLRFTPNFIDFNAPMMQDSQAALICGENRACLYDFMTTGDESFARETFNLVIEQRKATNDIQPVVTCPLPILENMIRVIGSSITVGSVLKFYCDEGYILHGVDEITCLSHGSWDQKPPQCHLTNVCIVLLSYILIFLLAPIMLLTPQCHLTNVSIISSFILILLATVMLPLWTIGLVTGILLLNAGIFVISKMSMHMKDRKGFKRKHQSFSTGSAANQMEEFQSLYTEILPLRAPDTLKHIVNDFLKNKQSAKGKYQSMDLAAKFKTDSLSNDVFKMTFQKGHTTYIATATDGQGDVLQGRNSDVKLIIPKGIHCTVLGYIHTHTHKIYSS